MSHVYDILTRNHSAQSLDCRITQQARDYTIGIINTMKAKPSKKRPMATIGLATWYFLEKCSIINEHTLPGLASFERCDITEYLGGKEWSPRGGVSKQCTHVIWQGLLEYTKNAWDITHKDAEWVVIYDNALGKYGKIWGGNKLLCCRNNTRSMHWNIRAPNVA